MLQHTSKHVRECHERAADCRRRAREERDADTQAYWHEQEAHWLKLAASHDLSARITSFLHDQDADTFSPEAEEGVNTLVDIFDRVCRALELDLGDETVPRKIARSIIEATLAGECDPENLFLCGLNAAAH